MLKNIRIVSGAIALVLSAVALFYLAMLNRHDNLIYPESDPKYADLVAAGFSPIIVNGGAIGIFSPIDAHQAEYISDLQKYKSDRAAFDYESESNRNSMQNWTAAAALFYFIFGTSLLPWDGWSKRVVDSARSVSAMSADFARKSAESVITSNSAVVGRTGLKSYSVADELLKWNKLLEDGVVTEEEFDVARAELLKNRIQN